MPLRPFKRLLDVWISEYFDNKGAKHTTRLYAGAIVADNYSKANPEDKQAIETALALAKDKRFFHWELEFPEVFFDETKRKENGGFDAVVGNPPYVGHERKGMIRPLQEGPLSLSLGSSSPGRTSLAREGMLQVGMLEGCDCRSSSGE